MKFFKKKYFLLAGILCYLLFNYSCLTMRSSKGETKAYFESHNIPYMDSVLRVGNRNVHYIATGKANAPTLVFIHGSPGSWDAYKNYLSDADLLGTYRMIAPDRPGFGFSDFRKSMGLSEQAILLNEALSQLDNGSPVTLLGHSYGGPLVVEMALENPLRYANLVILAGALDPLAEKPERWRYPFHYFPLKYLVPGSFKPANDELIYLKTDLKQLEKKLFGLSQNVLIMHGTKDRLVPYGNVSFMEQKFTGTAILETITLPDQGHFFIWEEADLVKKSVLEWLGKIVEPQEHLFSKTTQ